MLKGWSASKTNIVILAVIVAVAVVVSIFSYQYSTLTSNRIVDISSQEVRSNARIEVHDLSQILSNKLQTVSALLQTLTPSPLIQNDTYQKSAFILFNSRQQATSELTNFYMWLDRNGKVVWISNINQTAYQKYKGTDLSNTPYFTVPKSTNTAYYSSLTDSNDKIPRLYISYPIINSTTGIVGTGHTQAGAIFKGVVVAGIRANTLGNLLKNQLFSQFNSTLGLLDRNGIILYSNPQQYVGENIFGHKFQSLLSSALIPPESKKMLNDLLKRSLQGYTGSGDILVSGKMNTIAYEPVPAGGKNLLTLYISAQQNLASNVSTLIDQQRYFTLLVVTIISAVAIIVAFLVFSWNRRLETTVRARTAELALANQQLLATEKAKEEFISMISHELKTPLVPLKGYAQMLLRPKIMGAELNERQKNAINAMNRNIEKLQTLVDDVMDVYKLDMGKLKFTMTDTDITKLINETISELRPLTLDKKIDLKADIEANGTVFCDPNRIEQVLSNLIKNSIDFVPDGNGKITVRVQKGDIDNDSKTTLFTVEDDGIGINPEKADKLFQKFYQIDTGPTRKHAGTGLGLVICRGIIDAHGGRIWLDKTYRNGAAIKFTLPRRGKQVE